MPNTSIPATGKGLPNTTRRALLWGLAATSTAAAVAVAPDAHGANVVRAPSHACDQAENPELISAYDKFYDACAELKEAQDAFEWLADEWRHQWPLAPEELLLNANAQENRHSTAAAERDIIGRFLLRDTNTVTKRLSREFRGQTRQTCFTLLTSEKARELLDRWERHAPKGRTEKSLARNVAFREEAIKKCTRDIGLAERYEAQTARLRTISGVDAAQARVRDVSTRMRKAADEVSRCDARTMTGLGMKADALTVTASELMKLTESDGTPLGQFARLVKSVAEVAGRASV
ncbi:hypothetical protein CO662_36740 [Rhizobium anhuiense]|uniref:Secreted protein n=1 Tax=Rhizobium anhuiense TaxID=1184720 RepID=A0ABX4IY71_9HYPH|nr:hypothetical protein [Rhizobium anhuiense]PDS45376.1 hypothetical protein CO668_08655 [Rhizobium anhuiense]PDS45753.1 hypothetical protein CO662_36740 [Rhizobium anhuiense]